MSLGFFSMSEVAGGDPRFRNPENRIPTCGKCGLNKTCRTPRMPPHGEGRRKILVVAEAPGKQEDLRGIPLVGESGQKLRDHLEDVGVDLDSDCWKTNAVVCRPPDNRTPTPDEIEGCRPWLFKTVKKFNPNVIILLGKTAVESMIGPIWGGGIDSMERWVGWAIPNRAPRAWIVPTWHPSFLLRMDQKVLDLLFRQHLRKAVELSDSPPPEPRDFASEVRVEFRPRIAAKLIKKIVSRGLPISFDYETNCLKPERRGARIVSCALSNGQMTVAYPWLGDTIPATREFLASPVPKIGANIQYEERWSKVHGGGPVNNWIWDTMLAAHILDNRPGICGLKFQCYIRFGLPDYSRTVDHYLHTTGKGGLNKIREADLKDVLLYNGIDSLTTWELAQTQMAEIHGCSD